MDPFTMALLFIGGLVIVIVLSGLLGAATLADWLIDDSELSFLRAVRS